jgi:hypothetical protein
MDDTGALFIFPWYQDSEKHFAALDGYQNKRCRSYKLPLYKWKPSIGYRIGKWFKLYI